MIFLSHNVPQRIMSQRDAQSIRDGRFYIFEDDVIFCKWSGIFSIKYWRDGKKSVVSSFEKRYPSLVYGCLVDLSGDDMKVIRQSLQKNKGKICWGHFIGMIIHLYLKYY